MGTFPISSFFSYESGTAAVEMRNVPISRPAPSRLRPLTPQ